MITRDLIFVQHKVRNQSKARSSLFASRHSNIKLHHALQSKVPALRYVSENNLTIFGHIAGTRIGCIRLCEIPGSIVNSKVSGRLLAW